MKKRSKEVAEILESKVFTVQDAINELLSPVVNSISIPRGRMVLGDVDRIRTFAKEIANSKISEEKYYIEITK